MAKPISPSESASETGSVLPQDVHHREEPVVSPYVFMDVAYNLIVELAGGAEDGGAR